MERRVLLAIALSFAVLFVYQALLGPQPPAPGADNTTASGPQQAGSIGAPASPQAPAGLNAVNLTGAEPLPVSEPTVGESQERDVVVENDLVRAVFTNRGGKVRHWVLKTFSNDQEQPIDLVPENIPPEMKRPFALSVDDPLVTARLNDALYRVSEPEPGAVAFELETPEGLKVRKAFVLDPDTYIVSVTMNVTLNGQVLNPTIHWGPGMTDEIARIEKGSFLSPSFVYQAQAIYMPAGDSVEREATTDLTGLTSRDGAYRWAGVDDHYFITAVLHPPTPLHLEYQPVTIASQATPPVLGQYMSFAVRFPAPPEGARFYVGPKQLDVMRAIDPEFTRAIYFGMFAWLAAPLLDALRWVHGYVGSWGWSIIVLTILINLVMFPLRHKSVVSMRKMQELQPQMKAIQERYAKYKVTDPERQKMNSEVMDLYRTRGVNPASGCVPMLITLPFLFAFYAMLGQAIEIRGESFWWINDLALSDTLYIMPVLMGVSMFWQQRITPTTADPTQQKIMMFMPIMITVTMLFAPAGLVIYWLVSNIWSIGQQYITNALIGPPKPPAAALSKNSKDAKAAPGDIVVAPARAPRK